MESQMNVDQISSSEALKILEGLGVLARAEAAYDMAVEALNKQIPMKTGIPDQNSKAECGTIAHGAVRLDWSENDDSEGSN